MFFKTISMVLCIFCVQWIIFTFIIHFYIQIVPNLTNRNALKQFLCPFGMSFLFFKYFNAFLAQYVDILDSSWSFSPPVQESSFLQRSVVPFRVEGYLETKIWSLGVHIVMSTVSLSLGYLSRES